MISQFAHGCPTTNEEVGKIHDYYRCAKSFGWTPDQVDKVEKLMIDDLLLLDEIIAERQNQESK